MLVLPDDVPAHPYAVAMETAQTGAERPGQPLSVEGAQERIPLAVRHIRTFLKANRP